MERYDIMKCDASIPSVHFFFFIYLKIKIPCQSYANFKNGNNMSCLKLFKVKFYSVKVLCIQY